MTTIAPISELPANVPSAAPGAPFTELPPLVRIRQTGLAAGPADPGGGLWVVVQAVGLVVLVRLVMGVGRRLRTARRSAASRRA